MAPLPRTCGAPSPARPGRRRAWRAAAAPAAALALALLLPACSDGRPVPESPPPSDAGGAGAAASADDVGLPPAEALTSAGGPGTPQPPLRAATPSPGATTQVGALVDGFPVELLPVPADAVVLVTSAHPVGDADVQEVSLNLRTSMSVLELVTLYRTTLTDAGFQEVVPGTGGSTGLAAEVAFTRSGGDELVTVGVLEVDGARTLTIGGRVRSPA